MKKIIISLIMAAIIFCLPVSAVEEPVYLPNYGGISYRNDGSLIASFKVGTGTYFGQATSNNNSPGVYFEGAFELNQTYHVRYWFDVESITGLTIQNFFKDNLLIFTFIEGFDPDDIFGTSFDKRTNSLGIAYENLVTSSLTIDGNTAFYDVYFNTSAGNIDNITQSLIYYIIAHDCNRVTSGAVKLTVSHIQVEAWFDREAEIYEEILDQIAANQEVIINYGSDYIQSIPTNDEQLESSVSSVESAENAILSATDPDGSAMSDFSATAQNTLSTLNTSYNSTFAYINGLVDRVFDLGMGTVVFLSLTMGLVAYIFGRIR